MTMSATPPTVLVTGSSRGLGRGIALELAAGGCSVAIHAGSNRAAAEEASALCRGRAVSPEQIFPIVIGDVGDPAVRRRIFNEALAALDGHLDAFVSNAGITSPERKDVVQADESGFDRVMAVNVAGPHFLAQRCARHWLANPGASRLATGYKLIFVSSVSAVMASTNLGDYCMSKAALAMAAQVWAVRLAAHGVQVVELRPGIMATDMTAGVKEKYDPMIAGGVVPQRRWGTPEDTGKAVRSIIEGDWPFSNGAVIHIDGGLNLSRL
jgi:NAD(P)-dependent dehydrogenase (short-subunit alcohol dehydrogenase family)